MWPIGQTSATDTARYQRLRTNMSKTFKRVNPCIPTRILRACTDQLAGVFTDIFNQSLTQSVVSIVPVRKKAKVTEQNYYHHEVL